MKLSIIILVENINILLENTLYALDKFLDKNYVEVIYCVGKREPSGHILRYPSLKIVWVSDEKSIKIETERYLVMTEKHILKNRLSFHSLYSFCTLESFPHGDMKWTTNRYEWYDACVKYGIKIDEKLYASKCMTKSPQLFFRSLTDNVIFTDPVMYWFYLVKKNLTDIYTEDSVLWNSSLSENALHNSVNIDYLISGINSGCKNNSKFISICDVGEKQYLLTEALMNNLSNPTMKDLKKIMDQLVLYESGKLIRLGEDRDGGYLISDIPAGVLYGFGVGNTYKFESDFVELYGCQGILYDHTVDVVVSNDKIVHKKIGLNYYRDENVDTLENILKSNGHWGRNDLCLKMDIEGYEWLSILFSEDEVLLHFNQIIIELHWLHNDCNASIRQKIDMLEKINKNFFLIHIHGCNCRESVEIDGFTIHPVLEATYVRKNENVIPKLVSNPKLPHPLDRRNDSCLYEINLSDFYPYK